MKQPRGGALTRPVLLLVGAALAIGLTYWAWNSIEPTPTNLRWAPLVALFLVGVPLTFATSAAEFMIVGRVVGVPVSLSTALSTTALGTAANLLPVPGSVMTRLVVLRKGGAPTGLTVRALAVVGVLWVGFSVSAAGFGVATANAGIGALMALAGILVIAVCVALLHRAGLPTGDIGRLAVVEFLSVGLGAVRLALALASLGISVAVAEVVAVGASGALSVAAGIVPAGLGVREALAAVLGDVVGLGASESVVATALDRAVGLLGLIPAVGIAMWLRGREAETVGTS